MVAVIYFTEEMHEARLSSNMDIKWTEARKQNRLY